MKSLVHAAAGFIAMACIATFWGSTVVAELFLSPEAVATAKRFVVQGLLLLVPALAIAGGSGAWLAAARKGAIVTRKTRRMRIIAMNGLAILVPAAFYLRFKADAGAFDTAFIVVQSIELLAGMANLVLMGMNARDGLRLAGRGRKRPPRLSEAG